MRPWKVESVVWQSSSAALHYNTEAANTTLICSDDYADANQTHERSDTQTFLYGTTAGHFFKVQFFADPNRAPIMTPLSEEQAVNEWARLATGGTSPDMKTFSAIWPGITITNA